MTAPVKAPTRMAGYVSEDYYGQVYDEYFADTPADLLWPTSIPVFASMRRDPTVEAVSQGYGLQVRRATWQLDGAGCRPEVVQLVSDDLGLQVAGQNKLGAARTRGVSFAEYLRVALATMLPFGHFGAELGADASSGRARLTVLAERPPQTITQIHADPKTGEFLGISQNASRRDGKPQIRADHMVWHCRDRIGANWAGVSLYRSMWMPWVIKREMIRVAATSHRRWGAGVPVMEAIPGTTVTPEQMREAQALASAARAGEQAGAAVPPNFQMKILGLSGAVPDTNAFLAWLDRQISRAALMPHIELGQGSSGGARALGEAFIDSWTLALEALGSQVADEATRQIAARLVAWNFGPDEPVPSISVSGIGSRREVTAESLNVLLASGALAADPALETCVRREYRLPEREAPAVAPSTPTLGEQQGVPAPANSQAGVQQPGNAPADGLVAAAVAAAANRDWGALDTLAEQLEAAEQDPAPYDGEPAAHWAEVSDDTGPDWRAEAAMARGADIAAAYGSIAAKADSVVLRGFDIAVADAQIVGGQAPTLEAFRQQVGAKPAVNLPLDLDNRVVSTASRVGRHAAILGEPITSCPYAGADAEQTALRRVWIATYLHIRPPSGGGQVKASQLVLAAVGHPGSCEHATLGSVCECPCAGVRHSYVSVGGILSLAGSGAKKKAPAAGPDPAAPAPASNKREPAPAPEPATAAEPVGTATPEPEQRATPAAPQQEPPAPEPEPARPDATEPAARFVADLVDASLPNFIGVTDEQEAAAERGRQQIGAVLNGTYAGLNVEVTRVENSGGPNWDDDGFVARIRITDADGNPVGNADRVIYRDEDGNLAAYHELLELRPEVQGRGFASAFNRRLEEWYRAEGVQRIELTANIDVGGLAWARHGYDFADRDSAERIMARVVERLDGVTDPAIRSQAQALLARADNASFGDAGYPTPYEVSQLGHTDGAATWFGRDLMLGSVWEGVRWL